MLVLEATRQTTAALAALGFLHLSGLGCMRRLSLPARLVIIMTLICKLELFQLSPGAIRLEHLTHHICIYPACRLVRVLLQNVLVFFPKHLQNL